MLAHTATPQNNIEMERGGDRRAQCSPKYFPLVYVALYLVLVPLLAYYVIDRHVAPSTAKLAVLLVGGISLALQLLVALPLYVTTRGTGSEQWVLAEMLVPGFLSGKSKARASSTPAAVHTAASGEGFAAAAFIALAFVLPTLHYGAVIALETRSSTQDAATQMLLTSGQQLFLTPSSLAPRTRFTISNANTQGVQSVVGILNTMPETVYTSTQVQNETGRVVNATTPLRATFVVQAPTTITLELEEDVPARHQIKDRAGNLVAEAEEAHWSTVLDNEGVYTLLVTPGHTANTVTVNYTFTTYLYRYETSTMIEACDSSQWQCTLRCTRDQLVVIDTQYTTPNATHTTNISVDTQSQFIPTAGYDLLQEALFFFYLPVVAFSTMAIVNLFRWSALRESETASQRVARNRTACGCQFDAPKHPCGSAACFVLLVSLGIGSVWLCVTAAVGGYELAKELEWRTEMVLEMGHQKFLNIPRTITSSTVTVAGQPSTSVSALINVPPIVTRSYQYELVSMHAVTGKPAHHEVELIAGATLHWLIKTDAEANFSLYDSLAATVVLNQSVALEWQSSYKNREQQNTHVSFKVTPANSSSSSSVRVDFESLTTDVPMMNRLDYCITSCTGDCELDVGDKGKPWYYLLAEHTFQPQGSQAASVTITAPNDELIHDMFVTIAATVCTIFAVVFAASCAYNIAFQCKTTRINTEDEEPQGTPKAKQQEQQLTEFLLGEDYLSTTASTRSSISAGPFTSTTTTTTTPTFSADEKTSSTPALDLSESPSIATTASLSSYSA